MGEIGIDRDRFLYDMEHWEIQAVIRGYRKRQRPIWEAARLNAFFVMMSMADLSQAGVNSDRDLITFPWEKEEGVLPDESQVKDMKDLIVRINKGGTK